MPRERISVPFSLKHPSDEISVGDQVMVKSIVLGDEPCLAQIIEIKNAPLTCDDDNLHETTDSSIHLDNSKEADLQPNTSKEQIEQPERTAPLYYVHYTGTDRRLDEWIGKSRIIPASADSNIVSPSPIGHINNFGKSFMTRSQRRLNEDFLHMPKSYDDMDAYTRKLEMEHEERTKVKNIDQIQFGEWEIDVWYFSPFPLSIVINKSKLYVCEFCLWYSSDQSTYTCHMVFFSQSILFNFCFQLHQCKATAPPGKIVYENGNLAVWEVFGRKQKLYCQSLCLLSKLFLDHKTLYYDVEGFLFYVLCELDEHGKAHMVGHFSKEFNSTNNLACIMVLPPYQRNGYGKLLIQISYCFSEREGIVGTPEKPLSDLGKVSYRSYWWWVLIGVLDRELGSGRIEAGRISVNELSQLSDIHVDDIVETFKTLQLIKYWRGDHVVRINQKIISQIKQLHLFHPPKLILRKSAVNWVPNHERCDMENDIENKIITK